MKAQVTLLLMFSLYTTTVSAKRVIYFPSTTDSTSAAAIFNKSKTAYANLTTYLDSGKVVESTYNTEHPNKTAKVFRTAYTNSGGSNFEYYEVGKSNSLYTINKSSGAIKSWWGITNKITTPATINLALAGATGISSGTAAIIPNLLLTKDFQYNFYTSFTSQTINVSEKVGIIDCHKISGVVMSRVGPVTVWIGKKDFLIRKIETDYKISPEKNQIFLRKIDSLNEVRHKGDTAWLKNEAVRKAATARRNAIMDSTRSMRDFNVKSTYLFYPYVLKKMNPDLLKFRPNREIVL
jgi:hypothetical protein